MAKFKSKDVADLHINNGITDIRFKDGFYETDNKDEIELLTKNPNINYIVEQILEVEAKPPKKSKPSISNGGE